MQHLLMTTCLIGLLLKGATTVSVSQQVINNESCVTTCNNGKCYINCTKFPNSGCTICDNVKCVSCDGQNGRPMTPEEEARFKQEMSQVNANIQKQNEQLQQQMNQMNANLQNNMQQMNANLNANMANLHANMANMRKNMAKQFGPGFPFNK